MKLFDVAKVPTYCEGIAHRIERRKSGEVKVVDLTLKIDPFSDQLASAIDQAEYGFVKRMLFKQSNAEPVRDVRTIEFKPPADRQNLTCYMATDLDKGFVLEQVKVTKMRVRSQKDGDRWVLYLYVSFGPLSKAELEFVNAFYTEQRFITWAEAEPSLEFESDGDGEDLTDADEKARERQEPMWTDGDEKNPRKPKRSNRSAPKANRRLHSHQSKKKTSRGARA